MFLKKEVLLVVFMFFGVSTPGFTQTKDTFNPLKDEIGEKLEPLSALLDSAMKHDPYVQFRDMQVIINNCKLKANRSEWIRNIGVQADIRYGTFDNYSTNNSGGSTPTSMATTRSEAKYGYAAYVKFPIYDFVNRKNQIKLAKIEIQQAAAMAEVQRNEVRLLVIRQYNDLLLKQSLLKLKAKYIETARINLEMVEREFQNGVVSVGEYSRISEIVTRTEADFESARIDFITSYMVLEEIVGFKFNLTNAVSLTK
jgi:outer membrane protein TolC